MANGDGSPKVCDGIGVSIKVGEKGCKGLCVPYTSNVKPQSSEWYCPKCDTSYDMCKEDYAIFARRDEGQ